ncbi:phospholipase A [Lysobacter enzymogenes]|uniref:phospholipase A n=1 Tax=Lysobacter enzymogenes TaxID=69 RepID=UPI0008951326|nr:phospholipase A [Lysobacter enzymogenes]SDW90391.1 phospholipase A1 [Lysobacter enzymogenes]
MPHARPLLLTALAAAPWLASAQTAPTPATPQACLAITVDADRLACYDAALGRQGAGVRQADIAAKEAKAIQQNLELSDELAGKPKPGVVERARQASTGGVFAHDAPLSDAIANAGKGGLLDSRWELAKDSKLGVFNFRAYKPVYLLPVFWNNDPNTLPHSPNPRNTVTEAQSLDSVEAKFQISFKTKAAENLFGDNGDLWMGYTQSSRWQVYNGENSRPFRETNYEPEVLLVFRNNYRIGDWKGRMFAVGLNHQSNGRADPLSRSWNRVMFNIGLDREDWALMLRPWYRISDGNDDDNPDIDDYMGRGDLTLVHRRGDHEFALMARHSLRGGDRSHGALQFDWGFPINNQLRGHLQVFDGYGESLIDYNHKATYIGLGISLLEWY